MSRGKAQLTLATIFCFVPYDCGIFANIIYGISFGILCRVISQEFCPQGKVQFSILQSLAFLSLAPLHTHSEVH